MKPHTRVIQVYQDRLDAAVNRSPLLKATISNASRLLDCSRLQIVSENLSRALLDAVVEKGNPVSIDLRPRVPRSRPAIITSGLGRTNNDREDDSFKDDDRNRQLQVLFHLLDHRIRRMVSRPSARPGCTPCG